MEQVAEILIADDNSENLRVLRDILIKDGYKIRIAKNGKETLSSIEVSVPDLLLLDINMPEMNGFEVCQILKKDDSKFRELPVIFLSAFNDKTNRQSAFKAGGSDYLSKPFQIEEVKAKVRTHVLIQQYQYEIKKLKEVLAEKERNISEIKEH